MGSEMEENSKGHVKPITGLDFRRKMKCFTKKIPSLLSEFL